MSNTMQEAPEAQTRSRGRNFCRRTFAAASVATGVAVAGVASGSAFAAEDSSVTALATTAGTDIKDTAIAVIGALIPFGVSVYLVKKALPWAKSMIR